MILATVYKSDRPLEGKRYGSMYYIWLGFKKYLEPELPRDSIILEEKEDTRKNFVEVAISKNPEVFMLHGHGLETLVTGVYHPEDDTYDVILDTTNADIVSGKTVFAFSCLSGARLGPLASTKGAIYFGFNKELIFAFNPDINPEEDPYVDFQMRTVYEIEKLLLRYKNPRKIYAIAMKIFDDAIKEALKRYEETGDVMWRAVASCLLHDKEYFVLAKLILPTGIVGSAIMFMPMAIMTKERYESIIRSIKSFLGKLASLLG